MNQSEPSTKLRFLLTIEEFEEIVLQCPCGNGGTDLCPCAKMLKYFTRKPMGRKKGWKGTYQKRGGVIKRKYKREYWQRVPKPTIEDLMETDMSDIIKRLKGKGIK